MPFPAAVPTSTRVPYGPGMLPASARPVRFPGGWDGRAPWSSRGRLVCYVTRPWEDAPAATGVSGFLDVVNPIAGVIGSIVGADAAKSAAKTSAKYQFQGVQVQAQYGYKAAQLAAQTAREAAGMALQAERERANAEVRRAAIEANANVDALRVQRLASIDAQSAQLVANTQVGIFGLASRGISAAAQQPISLGRAAVVGAVVVAVAALVAMNPPKYLAKHRSKRGSTTVGRFRRPRGGPSSAFSSERSTVPAAVAA